MNKKGVHAELLTELAEHLYGKNIKKSERNFFWIADDGSKRETDVVITLVDGKQIAFEVRDRQNVQSIDWIDSVVGKYLNSNFEFIWICTHNDCTLSKEAIKKLNFHKIGWRKITSHTMPSSINVGFYDVIEPNFNGLNIKLDKKLKDLKFYATSRRFGDVYFTLRDLIKSQFYELAKRIPADVKDGVFGGCIPVDPNLLKNIKEGESVIEYELPFVVNTYVDKINESFKFKDSIAGKALLESDVVFKSELNTVFVKSDGTLCINIGLDSVFKDKILLPKFTILIEPITKLVDIKLDKLQVININGNPQNAITKIVGIK